MGTPASSLHRAVRLLHKTDSGKFQHKLTKFSTFRTDKQAENAFDEIGNTIVGMFNQWRQSSKGRRSAPVQLRFLLATAVEFNARDYVLHIAVFSSPHFSDAVFTKALLDYLVDAIKTAGGENQKLEMLCVCVLCAVDSESITAPNAIYNKCPG
jgi:hypothetical protein